MNPNSSSWFVHIHENICFQHLKVFIGILFIQHSTTILVFFLHNQVLGLKWIPVRHTSLYVRIYKPRIQQGCDTVPWQHLPSGGLTLPRLRSTTFKQNECVINRLAFFLRQT